MPDVDPPPTDEPEQRLNILIGQVQELQTQLGDRQRTDGGGRRLSSREYFAWRRDTQKQLNLRLSELRELRAAMKARGRRLPTSLPVGSDETLYHLRQLHDMVERLRVDDIDLDPDEITIIEEAGRYLDRLT